MVKELIVKTQDSSLRPRGRPPRISAAQIVTTALDLGLDAFSLDDISARLGVTTPALYSHVDGREDILRRAASQVMRDLEPDLGTLDDWATWLTAWAGGIRDNLSTIGEDVLEAVRTSFDQNALQVADHGLGLLVDAGLDPAEAAYVLWLTFRIAATAGPAGRPSVGEPLAQTANAERVSAPMAQAIEAVASDGGRNSWEFDLQVLIAGIAQRTTGKTMTTTKEPSCPN